MSPVLVFDRDAPAAKGARVEARMQQARELRAPRTEVYGPAIPAVLSPSSLNEFAQTCQVRWFYRKVLGLPERRSAHLGLGSAVHHAITENFRQKMHTREDLPTAGAVALFRDAWARELDQITLEKGDDAADMKEAGEVMTRLYMERAAPQIEPAAVEKRVEGVIGGVPVQGYIDVLDVHGTIIDLKTAKRATGQAPAGYRNQVATYAMLEPGANGKARLDTLTKGKTVDLKPTTIAITDSDRHHTTRLYSIAREQMASGVYAPNRAANLCSRKYCSFWERCMADYGGEVKR
jgi:RecB family exonuclease